MNLLKEKFIKFIDEYLIYLFIGFGVLTLLPNVSVFSGIQANSTGGIVYRGIVFGLIFILFILGLLCYKKLPNKAIILGCTLYLVTQVVTIFVSPLIKQVDVPAINSVIGVGTVIANIMTVFIAYFLLTSYKFNQDKFNIACYFLLGIGVALCLYTYIFQYKEIGSVLTDEHGWNYQVTSIFTSKNYYGFILLIISIFTVILALNTKKYWLYAFPGFFLFNSFLCRAKYSILFIFIILIAVLIHHLIHDYKNHEKAWNIALGVSAGVIVLLCLFTFVPLLNFGPFAKINYFIRNTILNDGVTVMKDRYFKSSNIIKAVDYPLGIMFGCGERVANYILAPNAEIRGDDLYVDTYGYGGLVKVILYLAFVAYVLYKVIKMKGEHKAFSILFVVIIILSGMFSENSIVGVGLTFLFAAPFIYTSPFQKQN
ncbi:MAG: hypothetical protein MJ232_00105 [archaeon]|nr:hypothetical protein [archaeon]